METVLDTAFVQVPFETVVKQVEGGRLVVNGLISLFQERLNLADREVEFSARAIKGCLHQNEIKQCSLERTLGFFKNYHLYNSKDQALYRKALDDEVLLPLNIAASKRASEIATQSKHLQHEEEQYAAAMEMLQKAKIKHEKLVEQITAIHAKLSKRHVSDERAEQDKKKGYFHGFFGSLDLEQEREKLKKKLEKLKQEYEASRKELLSRKNIVLEYMISLDRAEENATDIYEKLERNRLEKISTILKKFCTLERQYLENRLKNLNQLEKGAVSTSDPVADANFFVKTHKKPAEALRRSYALHILHLNHLSRDLPDNSFFEVPDLEESADDVEELKEAGNGSTDDRSSVVDSLKNSVELPSSGIKSNEINALVEQSRSSQVLRLSPVVVDEPEMCIQERIVKRNLDAIFGAAADEEDDEILSVSSHGPDGASSVSPLTSTKKEKVDKKKSRRRISFRKKSAGSHEFVFTDEHNAAYLAVHPEEWRSLFADSEGRKYFLQMLDEKRSRCAMLNPRGFRALTTAMQVFLDECEYVKDRTSAMRMANMGNTFHSYSAIQDEVSPRSTPVTPLTMEKRESEVSGRESGAKGAGIEPPDAANPLIKTDLVAKTPETNKNCVRKMYLQREKVIRDHSIWSSHRFWEEALQQGVIGQLKLTEAVIWDELSNEELHEAITAVQNIIFGQLGAMAFTMHEIGFSQYQVERRISDLCRTAQLPFDHRKMLMRSTAETFLRTHDEDHVSFDDVETSPTIPILKMTEPAMALIAQEGAKKDPHFASETKETHDESWWSDDVY